MSVRLIVDEAARRVALYDSTSNQAFGPVFDSQDDADAFLEWLPLDARTYQGNGLEIMHARWLASRPEID